MAVAVPLPAMTGPLALDARAVDALGEAFLAGRAGDARRYQHALADAAQRLRRFILPRLQRMAPALVGDAEDIVQECLIAVHLKAHTYDADQPFAPWLLAIARYKMIDALRRRQPGRHVSLDALMDEGWGVAEEPAEAPGTARDLNSLLSQLPDKQRRPIELVKLQGQSVMEAAAATGLSVSAVKVGIHRGLKALAKRMAQENG